MDLLDQLVKEEKFISISTEDESSFYGDLPKVFEDLDIYDEDEAEDDDRFELDEFEFRALFDKMSARGLDVENTVFVKTGIPHPYFVYSCAELDENPQLFEYPTQESVVKDIKYILKTGIYPRAKKISRSLKKRVSKSVKKAIEIFPGTSSLDFIEGYRGSESVIRNFVRDFDSAVCVGFDLQKLEVIREGSLYMFKDIRNRQDAVTVVGGFYLDKLIEENIPIIEFCISFKRQDRKIQRVIDGFLCDEKGKPIITHGSCLLVLGTLDLSVINQHIKGGVLQDSIETAVIKEYKKGNYVFGRRVDGQVPKGDSKYFFVKSPIEEVK